jgi:hypothetical protein
MAQHENSKRLVFTSDKPVTEDQLGTHKHLANLLVQITQSESDNPIVIGLFGGWGTGKSSIVKMYEKNAEQHDIKNIYLDAWVFANARERFGAGFLKSLAYTLLPDNSVEKFIRGIDEKSEIWETRHDISTQTWVYLLAVLFVLLGLVFLSTFWVGFNEEIKLNLMLFLVGILVVNGLLEFILPKIMTTSESRTIDESYNKVEHFKKKFQEVIQKSSYKTISVVVDNLDRVEPSDALEMIRMLKTFVNDDDLNGKRFVLIVPCDEQELAKHINSELYVYDAHEFLQKFFNISIPVPELVREDIVAFTKKEFDKVSGSLTPSLSDVDTSLVSFIISRAARRNPRQIKVLINSFVGYWQSAGLAGTAGIDRGISPLGAVVYISLSYLRKGEELPRKIGNVFSIQPKGSENELKEFLDSIREFLGRITDLEWSYLKRLQISDDEREIPHFIDIYFAVTDLNWKQLDTLITNETNIIDLISRLDTKVREEDSVSRERFVKWVFSLISKGEISAPALPYRINSYINYIVSGHENDWSPFADEGLAEYIIQAKVNHEKIIAILEILKARFAENRPVSSQIRFVFKLVDLSKSEFWESHAFYDKLAGVLDAAIYHLIPKVEDQFIELLLKNLQVVIFEGTGVRLAEDLIGRYPKNGFKDIDLTDIFYNLPSKNIGSYAFAARWLQLSVLSNKPVTFGKISLILQTVEALLDFDNISSIQTRLPNSDNFQEIVSGLEGVFVRGVSSEIKRDLLYGTLAMSLLSLLGEKLKVSRYTVAQNSFRDNLFPKLAGQFTQLDTEDKILFVKYLDKYPKILDAAPVNHLATLSRNEDLQLLSRLVNNLSQLDGVIAELIDRSYFGKVFSATIQLAHEDSVIDLEDVLVNAVFRVFERKAPPVQNYQEIDSALKSLKNREITDDLIKKHVVWLINRTDWNEKNSIEISVNKIKILENIVPIGKEIKTLLKEKIASSRVDILESILSDVARTWITNHLAIPPKKGASHARKS